MSVVFSALFDELRTRNSRAHASLLSPSTLPLRAWIERRLAAGADSVDALQATPVFEHKFGFRPAPAPFEALSPRLVHPQLLAAMDAPAEEHHEQRFDRTRRPYTHQVAAWEALRDDAVTSLVVSAGTGAGKTECFLVPILDALVRQQAERRVELVGVQALFLYPLNALINSQRERLSAWTRAFGGRIRYCLYNGETAESVPAAEQARCPERVLGRRVLRERPPPLLVTNATMLEYMLVRPQDQPILQQSRGQLRYVVIDEAHTYVGSMAAELALLLRRVMLAFGVDPRAVRFVATSATLGARDRLEQMQRFLADVAGQDVARVRVVTDEREIPSVPAPPPVGDVPDLAALAGSPAPAQFDTLCAHRAPQLLRRWLVTDGAQTARALRARLAAEGVPLSEGALVRLLDACAAAAPEGGEPFLPLRGHGFLRGLEGLWACLSPRCPGRAGTELDDPAWPFGAVYTGRRVACDCGAAVFELALCQQCGAEGVVARDLGERVVPVSFEDVAHPPAETEDVDTGDDEDEGGEAGDEGRQTARILTAATPERRPSELYEPVLGVDPVTGALDARGAPTFGVTRPSPATGKLQCPSCGHAGLADRLSFRSCRTGRDFVLGVSVPALLEHMPAEAGGAGLPFGGRRTLSFTDSRQGTARFAARAQGEAERNYVRSFVYHHVVAQQGVSPERLAELHKRVADLEAVQAQLGPSLVEASLRDARAAVAAASGPTAVPLREVAGQLANSPGFGALDRYWREYLPFADTGVDSATLAKWLVLREFARRPMRAASLETLGLVAMRLPNVGGGARPPEVWRRWCPDGADAERAWADLLKLLLDFFVRANSAVQIDRAFFRWVGTSIHPKVVLPNEPPVRNQRVAWPRFGRGRPRLGWLVVRAMGLPPGDREVQERVNDVFDEAWRQIQPALRQAEGGYQLPLDEILLEPVSVAWVCPMTRMLLDTALLGHTPYQPPLDRRFDTRCRKVTMPRVPHPFWLEGDARAWLESDPAALEARARGGLSEFAERVLVSTPYFQVREHSAQLHSSTLQRAERQFRAGRINLLSCSTTMEMGVDIGNLAGIAMNNAPPSPANFLQRVGRAGRRGERSAVSVTVCRHLPHDQGVFAAPDWPFRTPVHITPVRLDSQRIVERHVRSAALTAFLHAFTEAAIPRLTCAWFFVPGEGQTEAPADRLLEWLETAEDAALIDALEALVRESGLHGIPGRQLLLGAVPAFRAVSEGFRALRAAILEQRAGLDEQQVASLALTRQLRRLDEDYLLGYLASEQVLPGYGFPTGVVPFVTTTAEELSAIRRGRDAAAALGRAETEEQRQRRIDARTQLLGYPSRHLAVALLEYAPGSSVVIDRRTYVSRGVTLNWHLPANAEADSVHEVQAIREAWRCRACDTTGTAQIRHPACPACGDERLEWVKYLEPAGFAVDLREAAQMDAQGAEYVRVERPWIASGVGPFEPLGRGLVRLRAAPDGEILHVSRGAHEAGYAVCLRCGRAEPETEPRRAGANGPLPARMDGHRRLRGGRGDTGEGGALCEGNGSWAVQRHLALGGSARTDVLELRLYDPRTTKLVRDRTLLTTLAVALRKVAAAELGVDERELGYQVADRVQGDDRGAAILLYDTATGGAGFSTELPPLVPALLRRAVVACDCPRGCDQACHACLLSNDTQHDLAHIDRQRLAPAGGAAPELLTPEFLDALALPEPLRVFGPDTALQWGEPRIGLVRHVRRLRAETPVTVQLHVHGEPDGWDPVSWSGRTAVRQLRELPNVRVRLMLPASPHVLGWQERRQLAALAEAEGVELAVGDGGAGALGLWATVADGRGVTGFAADRAALPLSADWAVRSDDVPFVTGPVAAVDAGQPVSPDDLVAEPTPGVVAVDLRRTGGPARQFGRRFWGALDAACPGLLDGLRQRGAAERVLVQDRYLMSPLAVSSVYAVLAELAGMGIVGEQTRVRVLTRGVKSDRPAYVLRDNWRTGRAQRAALEGLLRGVTPNVEVEVTNVGPDGRRVGPSIPHHRVLRLWWGATAWEVRLDAGFGYLEAVADRWAEFPFDRSVDEQVSKLLRADWGLRPGRWEVPAYVVRGG